MPAHHMRMLDDGGVSPYEAFAEEGAHFPRSLFNFVSLARAHTHTRAYTHMLDDGNMSPCDVFAKEGAAYFP